MFKSGYFLCIKLLMQSFYRVGYGILVTLTVMNPIYTMGLGFNMYNSP